MSEAKPRSPADDIEAIFKRLVQIEKRMTVIDARNPEKTSSALMEVRFFGHSYETWSDAYRIMCELTGMEDPKAAMENIEARIKLGADVRKKVEALDTIKSLWFRPSPPETEWRVIDENSAFAIQAALKKAYGAP